MTQPVCPLCSGRGGFYNTYHKRWQVCRCKRPTKAQREAQKRLNSIGAVQEDLFKDIRKPKVSE